MKLAKNILWNLLLISVGSVLCALAIKGILIPKQFLAGGLTGLSLLLYYLFPFMPVGVIYFVLNIPLFLIGWMFVGRRFLFYSLAGVAIFSAVMLLSFPLLPIHDMILSAMTAGIITGLGSGIILKSFGSAGGLDILTVILFKKYAIRPGTFIMAFNGILLLLSGFRIPLEMVLYTLMYLFVTTYFMNLVLVGMSQRKALMIISPKWNEISNEIMDRLQRGVTIVHGKGGYSGKEVNILYSVITISELSRFKEMIRKIDPEAFVVVTETLEVMGKRIGNQPHW
jgi:uncharacterized membrane-anchored protein YitT (DUF2179 family)